MKTLILVLLISAAAFAQDFAVSYSPKINPATGKPFGIVALRTDRRQFLYLLNDQHEWTRVSKYSIQISDAPIAIIQTVTGSFATSQDAFAALDAVAGPAMYARVRAILAARNAISMTKFEAARIPWPPYDPKQGESP